MMLRLVLLPIDYRLGYRVSLRHGLSTQSLGAWLLDWLKVTALALVLGVFVTLLFYACLAWLGAGWWWAYAVLRQHYGEKLLDTTIRSSIAYAESAERATSILDHRPDLGVDAEHPAREGEHQARGCPAPGMAHASAGARRHAPRRRPWRRTCS